VAEVVDLPTGNTVSCDVNGNDLANNSSQGVYNDFSNLVDATANWWGDASGPGQSLRAAAYEPSQRLAASPYSAGNGEVPVGYIGSTNRTRPQAAGSPVTANVDYSPGGVPIISAICTLRRGTGMLTHPTVRPFRKEST